MPKHFPYKVADGYVALAYVDEYHENKDGIEEPHKKIKIRSAVVVAVADDVDQFVVGTKVLMPSVSKQQFEIEGQQYYVCHYLDIKVIDPIDDDDLMLKMLEDHFAMVPKRVSERFGKKLMGL